MPADALSPSPIQRFVDNNGNALVGGLLFTYAAGTTTKQATYTDFTGATQQTNPIVLNSRGEPENNLGASVGIWLQNLGYKFVLAPAGDTDPPTNPIWTLDDITASPDSFPIPNDTVLGNVSGAPALPYAITQVQLTALIDNFTSTLAGDVPASGGGTANFLRADGMWATPAGASYTASGGITLSGTNFALTPIGNNTVLGNVSGGSASAVALDQRTLTSLIVDFTTTTAGVVPGSGGGTTNFLRADGNWAAPPTAPTGILGAVYTAGSYTLILPAANLKFTLVGAGGGGDGSFNGGNGAIAIFYLANATPGNTLTLVVGAGGASGSPGAAGAATVLSSGTQTISTVTANGGGGANGSTGTNGTASGGSLNLMNGGQPWNPYGVGALLTGTGGSGLAIAEW